VERETIRFYFDYKSPFAYLAKDEAYRLEEDYRVQVEWLPVILDIAAAFGGVETRTELQWRKVRYMYLDARRWANERGLVVRGPQKIFDSTIACMGALYAMRQRRFRPYNDRVFARFWARELDIENRGKIAAVLAEVGAETQGFAAYTEEDGRAEMAAIQERADQEGVFGVPTFVVGSEPFWGNDRVPWVRKKLDALGVRR